MKKCNNCGWDEDELNEGRCPTCGDYIEMEQYYIETKMTSKEVDSIAPRKCTPPRLELKGLFVDENNNITGGIFFDGTAFEYKRTQ